MVNRFSVVVYLQTAAANTLPMGDSKGNSATLLLRGKARKPLIMEQHSRRLMGRELREPEQNETGKPAEITTVLATIRADYTQNQPDWGA